MTKSRHILAPRAYWTSDEEALLTRLYPTDLSCSEIAGRCGHTLSSTYQKARKLGLSKPEGYLSRAGRKGCRDPRSIATRFPKGHVPANKGGHMTEETYRRCAPTMFHKGNTPHNHEPVGTEVVVKGGYVKVKIAEPRKWKLKHRMVWEAAHGEIPKGCNIQFRDGNRQNCSLDNLYIIPRTKQARQNSMWNRYPRELCEAIQLRGALKRQLRKRKQEI